MIFTDTVIIHAYTDCQLTTHFTNIFSQQGFSILPSYEIKSKARIEEIDFMTYIFGTWFGFPF